MRALALLAALAGCAEPQFVVHVDTDAPVPPRPGAQPDPLRPRALFDRLRVELMRAGQPMEIAGTRRDFAVDEGVFADRRVSFGVAPPLGEEGYALRVRLFHGDHLLAGEPAPTITLERTVLLPTLDAASGAIDLRLTLRTDDIGQPMEIAAERGTIAKSVVSSWPGATVVPCNRPPGPTEACIPGGAFLMGDPVLHDLANGLDAERERLVVVSPFFIDIRETTVKDFRTGPTALQFAITPEPWKGTSDPNTFDNWCTYTAVRHPMDPDDAHAKLSVNCIAHQAAKIYCQRRGGDLPTEAQFEKAASSGDERAYAWGGDPPTCDDAVWGWGGLSFTESHARECRTDPNLIYGTHPSGSGKRDRVHLIDPIYGDERDVTDLAGNLGEWMRDRWSRQDESFWSRPGVFIDPVADLISSSDGEQMSVRSGYWYDPPLFLRAAARRSATIENETFYFYIGIRCVRPGS